MLGYDPDDAFLLALGKLTWSAMVVEDRAYEITGALLHRDERGGSAPIGTSIDCAVKRLGNAPPAEPLDACRDWLVEATDALKARNSVVHSVVKMPIDPAGQFLSAVLSHRPPRSTEYRDRPLAANELGSIAATLASLADRYDDVWAALTNYLLATAASAVAAGRCRRPVNGCLACDAIGIDCD
jgi:hypothetical protein